MERWGLEVGVGDVDMVGGSGGGVFVVVKDVL